MNIFDLTGQMLELLHMAEEEYVDQKAISDTLEGLEGEFEEKAEGYAKVIESLKGDAESLKCQIDRLTYKKKVLENNIDAVKKNLENAMIAVGKKKFKTPMFGFSIQKNAPSLVILDEDGVPKKFWKEQAPALDKKAALDYIKEHGTTDWGATKQTESLRIR